MRKTSAELNVLVNFGSFTKQFDIQQLRIWKLSLLDGFITSPVFRSFPVAALQQFLVV